MESAKQKIDEEMETLECILGDQISIAKDVDALSIKIIYDTQFLTSIHVNIIFTIKWPWTTNETTILVRNSWQHTAGKQITSQILEKITQNIMNIHSNFAADEDMPIYQTITYCEEHLLSDNNNEIYNDLNNLPDANERQEKYRNEQKPKAEPIAQPLKPERKNKRIRNERVHAKLELTPEDPSMIIRMKYWLSNSHLLSDSYLDYVNVTFHWKEQMLNELRVIPCKKAVGQNKKSYFYVDDKYRVDECRLNKISDIVFDIVKPMNWNLRDKDFSLSWQNGQTKTYELQEIILSEATLLWQLDGLEHAANIISGYVNQPQFYYYVIEGNLFGMARKLSKFIKDIRGHKRREAQFVQMSDGQKGLLQHKAFAVNNMKRL